MRYDDYIDKRKSEKGIFSYGLSRRLNAIEKGLKLIIKEENIHNLYVLDFGCADDVTLNFIQNSFYDVYEKGVGLDIFVQGMDFLNNTNKTSFIKINLSKEYPYPFKDQSFNIAICSAFLKHHPDPKKLLSEIWRILKSDGFILLLDPNPWVVKLGMLVNYFDKKYVPSIWSKNNIELECIEDNIKYKYVSYFYDKYWIAPNKFLYALGIEKICPKIIRKLFGLHQILILKKHPI